MNSTSGANHTTTRYYVSSRGTVHGPLKLPLIEALVQGGEFSPDIQICEEGRNSWSPLGLPSHATGHPVNVAPMAKKKLLVWPVTGGLILFIVLLLIGVSSKPSEKQVETQEETTTDYSPPKSPAPAPYRPSTPSSLDLPSSSSSSRSSSADSYRFSPQAAPQFFSSETPSSYGSSGKGTFSGNDTSTPSTPQASPSPKEDMVFTDADGRVYSVPQYAYDRLYMKRLLIETRRKKLDEDADRHQTMAEDIERSRKLIDRSSQYSVDQFNRKVDRYNAANSEYQRQLDSLNVEIDEFNSELQRVGKLIR